MKGANKKDAATGAIRMVQVSAPGATSRARCTRRSPLLRDALFATSSNPSAPAPEVLIVRGAPLRREKAEGPRSGVKKWGESPGAPLRREKAGRKSRGPAPA